MENKVKNTGHGNYLFGMHPIFEAIEAKKNIEKVWLKKGLEGDQFRELLTLLTEKQIPFQFVPVERLNKFTKGRHQGVVAQLATLEYTPIEDAVETALSKSGAPVFLLLDGVSDVRNFGAIARTAECSGADCIILPAKGGASITPDSIKTSAGALMRMPVCKVPNLKNAIYYLKECGFDIIAATEKCDALIYTIDFTKAVAIVMGSEEKGISEGILALCDRKGKIPMTGTIGSLNVSAAASVVLYEVVRQRLK